MIDYSTWKRRRFSVTSLKLDKKNPRLSDLGENPSTKRIIEYFFDKEDLGELIKSISTKGYLLSEEPIVTQEKESHVVLEGNRRVAACKVLINPKLAPKSKQKFISKQREAFNIELIKKIYTYVAPARKDADIVIQNRHTKTQIHKWDKIKQYRFFYSLVAIEGETIAELQEKFGTTQSKIRSSIGVYHLYEKALELDLDEDTYKKLKDESKFNATTLERICTTSEAQEYFGFSFRTASGELIFKVTEKLFERRYKLFIEDLINDEKRVNSRKLNTSAEIKGYIDGLKKRELLIYGDAVDDDDESFSQNNEDNESVEGEGVNAQAKDNKRPTDNSAASDKSKPRRRAKTYLIPKDFDNKTNIDRIDTICKELKSLDLEGHGNAAAVLFRSYLDMVIYQYLSANGGIKKIREANGRKTGEDYEKKLGKLTIYLNEFLSKKGVKVTKDFWDLKKLKKAAGYSNNLNSDWVPTLFEMLNYLADGDNKEIDDPKLVQALRDYLNKKSKVISHFEMNYLVHNEYKELPSPEELRSLWINLNSVIKKLYKGLKEH